VDGPRCGASWDSPVARCTSNGSDSRLVKRWAACGLLLALNLIAGCGGGQTEGAGGTSSPTSSLKGAPSATASEGPQLAYFPGFWPVARLGEAQALQREVDQGRQPWRIDPREVAKSYAREVARWEIKVLSSEIAGSQQSTWTSTVVFQPLIGESEPPNFPGPRHTMTLVGVQGVARPAWFVSSLRNEEITVDTPSEAQVLSSPLRLTGRGRAYEGTIHVRLQDDNGVQLYPRAGEPGVVQVGAATIEPFEGSIPLQSPSAGAGILIVTGDTGAGPVPTIVVLRVRFSNV
jgi:hypothetical protein